MPCGMVGMAGVPGCIVGVVGLVGVGTGVLSSCWPVADATCGGVTGAAIGVEASVCAPLDAPAADLPLNSASIAVMICAICISSLPSCTTPTVFSTAPTPSMNARSALLVEVDSATAAP